MSEAAKIRMMTSYGGCAFPIYGRADDTVEQMGLSVRDWFAGQSLAGMMAKASAQDVLMAGGPTEFVKNIVEGCWALADAMLTARKG